MRAGLWHRTESGSDPHCINYQLILIIASVGVGHLFKCRGRFGGAPQAIGQAYVSKVEIII